MMRADINQIRQTVEDTILLLMADSIEREKANAKERQFFTAKLGQCNKEILDFKESVRCMESALEHEKSLNQHIFVEEYTAQLCTRAMMQSKQMVEPGCGFLHGGQSASERHSETYEAIVDTKCEKIRSTFLEHKCTGYSIEIKKHQQTIEDLHQKIKVHNKKLEV